MDNLSYFTEVVLNNPGEGLYSKAFDKYQKYVSDNEDKIPFSVVNLVKSDWYFNARDPRCPKDGWVVSKRFENNYDTKSREKIPSEFEIKLLGAYHDCYLHFLYKEVVEISIDGNAGSLIEKDYDPWRIDEFSVSDHGTVIHKIYFFSGKVWTIKCRNFEFDVSEL